MGEAALANSFFKTAMYDCHIEKGARMVPFAGYDLPVSYTSVMEEHLHVRSSAGVFDVSHMGVLTIEATDNNIETLKKVIPLDLELMEQGQQKYSVLLNQQGNILDDLIISRFKDYFLLVVNGASKEKDIQYLKTHVVVDFWQDMSVIAVQGPKSREVISHFYPPACDLCFFEALELNGSKKNGWISCSGYTGEDGFEIILPNEKAKAFFESLCAQDGVKPIGLGARDSLRLEAGLCLYGHDMDQTYTPLTADLKWTVGKNQRAEPVFYGADKTLTQPFSYRRKGFISSTRAIAREGVKIIHEGQEMGYITSGGFSPTLQKPIAMGYLKQDFCHLEKVTMDIRGKKIEFEVTNLPFIPTNYKRREK